MCEFIYPLAYFSLLTPFAYFYPAIEFFSQITRDQALVKVFLVDMPEIILKQSVDKFFAL